MMNMEFERKLRQIHHNERNCDVDDDESTECEREYLIVLLPAVELEESVVEIECCEEREYRRSKSGCYLYALALVQRIGCDDAGYHSRNDEIHEEVFLIVSCK